MQKMSRPTYLSGWFLAIIGFLFMSRAYHHHLYAQTTAVNYESNQIVVKVIPPTTVDEINTTYGTTTHKSLLYNAHIYLLQVPAAAEAAQIVTDMQDDPNLLYAEINLLTSLPEASGRDTYGWPDGNTNTNTAPAESDPRLLFEWSPNGAENAHYQNQPAVHNIKLAQAQAITSGSGTIVAVLDTGIELSHPVLIDSITNNGYDFIDNDTQPEDQFNGLDDDNDGFVDEAAGHGTHIAGLIHLVAPAAQIMPLRVLDSEGQGNSFVIAEAMLYAMEHNADIINLSLGTTRQSQFLLDVVQQVTTNGVLVVAAAGNLDEATPQYPAASPCALAVTAVGPGQIKADYANYGTWVDLVAPGHHIYSTYPNWEFAWWNGTSMAAPFVSGQAALIHSFAPGLTLEETGQLIANTAQSLDNANQPHAGQLGAGLIHLQDSLSHLVAGTWPTTTHNPLAGCGPEN